MRRLFLLDFFLIICLQMAAGQTPKDVRAVAKQGPQAIPTVAQYLNSTDLSVRLEVVKQLVNLGGPATIDPLNPLKSRVLPS